MKTPYEFIMDELASEEVTLKHMFGCYGVYVEGKVYLFLRKQPKKTEINGIWIAVSHPDHFISLLKEFPGLKNSEKQSNEKKSKNIWLMIPESNDHFEEYALKACKMILKRDERIGKITKGSTAKKTKRK